MNRKNRNPFECAPILVGGKWMRPVAGTVDERVRMVSRFTAAQCNDALRLPDHLQKGVVSALYRRLCVLERTA